MFNFSIDSYAATNASSNYPLSNSPAFFTSSASGSTRRGASLSLTEAADLNASCQLGQSLGAVAQRLLVARSSTENTTNLLAESPLKRRDREETEEDLSEEEKAQIHNQNQCCSPGLKRLFQQQSAGSPSAIAQALMAGQGGGSAMSPLKLGMGALTEHVTSQPKLSLITPGRSWGTSRFSLPPSKGDTPEGVRLMMLDEKLPYSQSIVAKFTKEINSIAEPTHRQELILRLSTVYTERLASEKLSPPETIFTQPEARANLNPLLSMAPLPLKIQQHVNNVEIDGKQILGGHFLSCYKEGTPYVLLDTTEEGVSCIRVGEQRVFKTCFPSCYANVESVFESALADKEKIIAVGELASGAKAYYVKLGSTNNHLAFAIISDSKKCARATVYPLYCIRRLTREQSNYRVGKAELTYDEIKAEIDRQYADAASAIIFYYKNLERKLCAIFEIGPAFKSRTGIPQGVCFVREVNDQPPPTLPNLTPFQTATVTNSASALAANSIAGKCLFQV